MTERAVSVRRGDSPQGKTKIVYAWEDDPFSTDHFDVISPRQLNDLMEEGWSQLKSERRKIMHPVKKKLVSVDRITLGQEGAKAPPPREVARREEFDEMGNPTGRALMQPGGGHQLSRGGSYLGDGSDFAGLGLNLASSKMTENAFGMGVDCAKTGGTKDNCPFPPGNPIYTKWQNGFAAGVADTEKQESGRGDPVAAKEAYALGAAAGRLPDDAAVDCPYSQGSFLFKEWLRGFTENGGKHIEE